MFFTFGILFEWHKVKNNSIISIIDSRNCILSSDNAHFTFSFNLTTTFKYKVKCYRHHMDIVLSDFVILLSILCSIYSENFYEPIV